jgi:hypothetical protein
MELIWVKRAEHVEVVCNVPLRARWAEEPKFISSANTHMILHLSVQCGNAVGHLLMQVITE